MTLCLNCLKQTATILIFAVAICSAALAQVSSEEKNVEQQIKKLEQARLDAYLHLDAKALNHLMSNDYTSIYANGEVVTKARELDGIKAAPAGTLSSITASIDQLFVRSYGNAAVLRGILTVKGKIDWSQKDIDINASFRYTAIYVKMQDSWRITFSQFTAIEPVSDK
jgi:ketosteroid isomerase-like protein